MDQELWTELIADGQRTHMQQRAPDGRCVRTHQMAALFWLKRRDGCDVKSKIRLPSINAYVLEERSEFYPDPIWNDQAL